ncbi:alpha/beta hydrolase [Streptomyces sp. NBC_01186]|uniref:alpha/beta fold hydrolase n=1 Tax=unclassified Streptomyces TaxID=2593676 RepID=UPI002DDAB3A8|nr:MULTISPECIES: alpha/beta hydrolase [unclassified Streptomyces]WSB80256.1 alpha/beta hydrolase [Streptomyces sp. NBC_01775]WSS11534.1 alpha/beta hydrolase [Streptomyces sp. NBC_01186]
MPQPPSGPIPAPGPGPRSARPEPLSGALSASPPAAPPGGLHRLAEVPGGRIHLVEQGTGPLVLLVHGFPEGWYSWRHQLPALAAAGYRAVAVDVRGYGRSSKPGAVSDYRMLAHVADNVGVVHALGERTATVVGHDWGATIAANSALLRPDVFTAVGLLGVPYAPRGGIRPTEAFAALGGTEEFYVSYFQQPGRAEAEIEADVRGWLAGFYASLSADTGAGAEAYGGSPYFVPEGARMADRFVGGRLPGWLSEAELDVYAGEFERTGLTGALNRYRNVDRDWADLAAWDGAPIGVPSLFVGGELDSSTTWLAPAIEAFPRTLPGLRGSHLLPGCGHWVQQERPEEVNGLLVGWLEQL